jgi:hypothetical protein
VTHGALLLIGALEKSSLFANFELRRLAESRSATPRRFEQHARQESPANRRQHRQSGKNFPTSPPI